MKKNLIAYFSWSGNTERLANNLAKELGIETVKIERAVPYSEDYNECAYVEAKEEVKTKNHPQIRPINVDFANYDNILVFFPIWWYTMPMPVLTFLDSLKGYQGKVYLFANSYTNDPAYVDNYMRDTLESCPDLNINQGLFNQHLSRHVEFIKAI